ncbi:MAG: alpha/beta hydrolase [Sulfuricellaceae bacterium]
MPPPVPCAEGVLHLPEQEVFYRVYRKLQAPPRRLLLLHGGGVDGGITWSGILPHLAHWNEILVPDLRGAGKTRYPDQCERDFEVEEVVADIEALLTHLGWGCFDLGGYSYGGLIAMLLRAAHPVACDNKTYLLEPALLGKISDDETRISRELMLHAAKRLRHREHVKEGLDRFLDAVAPNRTRGSKNEAIVRRRLSHRPAGLACTIECVSRAGKRLDRSALVAAQSNVSSFIGDRSSPEIHALCRTIAASRTDWLCHLIQGADHALPFQKAQIIAELMNADLEG